MNSVTTAAMAALVARRLGEPWQRDGLHCWRFTREAVHELTGIDLPPVLDVVPGSRAEVRALFATRPAYAGWREVAARDPVPSWAVAFFARGGGLAEHAGLYLALDGGGVLHCDRPHGVVFDDMARLRLRGLAPPVFYVPA